MPFLSHGTRRANAETGVHSLHRRDIAHRGPPPHDAAMLAVRPLPFALAVLVSTVGEIAAVTAQTSSEPAKASPTPVKAAPMADIAFYLARGDADACGRGCSEWIAAEGKIDPGAASRLRRLLAKLGHRKPPIYFHSPGGSVAGAIELGRLFRDQKLEVSVGHTIPHGCDRDKPLDKSCEALKRSGQELESEFDQTIAMCNSSCVWALAGGAARFVPPWVKLAIHDVGFDPDKPSPRGAALAEGKRVAHARIQDYLRDMGIDKGLLTASAAIPFESMRYLERDELVRFGMDRREFGETVWHFADRPSIGMSKRFFVRTGNGDQARYRNGLVSLGCGMGQEIRLAVAREHDGEQKSGDAVRIDANGRRIALQYQTSSREFDIRSASLSADMFDAVGHGANIQVSGTDRDGPAGSITLSMDGFSDAAVKLRKRCEETAHNTVAAAPPSWPVTVPQNLANLAIFGAKSPPVPNQPAPQSSAVAQNAPAAPIPARPPQTIELTRVAAGELRLRLDFLYSIQPDCSSAGTTTVRIIEQPQHGTLAIETGQGYTSFPKDNQRYDCNTRRSDGTLVFYEPGSGYTGADSVILYVLYPLGAAQTRHYAVEVR
jgi:hypothetical protein